MPEPDIINEVPDGMLAAAIGSGTSELLGAGVKQVTGTAAGLGTKGEIGQAAKGVIELASHYVSSRGAFEKHD